MLRPKFAVLDEIDSGLDVDALDDVGAALTAAVEEWGLGVIAITHSAACSTCCAPTTMHVFVRGRIVAERRRRRWWSASSATAIRVSYELADGGRATVLVAWRVHGTSYDGRRWPAVAFAATRTERATRSRRSVAKIDAGDPAVDAGGAASQPAAVPNEDALRRLGSEIDSKATEAASSDVGPRRARDRVIAFTSLGARARCSSGSRPAAYYYGYLKYKKPR